jgi:xylulokinase
MYLGLDLSTQKLKATIMDDQAKVVVEEYVHFDSDLDYGTVDGVVRNGLEVYQNPRMFLDALDLLLCRLGNQFDLKSIKCISGCAQQHGSVYLSGWPSYHMEKSLNDLFDSMFSFDRSPNWQDHSTTEYCKELSRFPAISRTGSEAFERFTGPQIAKVSRLYPDAYRATRHIFLISNFLASVLVGRPCPIDPSDASGMNLMDLETLKWIPELMDYCGAELESKLGISGTYRFDIHPFFQKYGLARSCQVVTFTGDNPSTFCSYPVNEGDILLSLGTSDTLMFCSETIHRVGHLFKSPLDNGYLSLLCFKNGSLLRERLKGDLDWEEFNHLLRKPSPQGLVALHFAEPEILPAKHGLFCFHEGKRISIDELDPEIRAILIVEGQCLNMKYHLEKSGFQGRGKIICTGGGSQNKELLQILANVFDMPVFPLETKNAASLGACFRAKHYFDHPEPFRYSFSLRMECAARPKSTTEYREILDQFEFLLLQC